MTREFWKLLPAALLLLGLAGCESMGVKEEAEGAAAVEERGLPAEGMTEEEAARARALAGQAEFRGHPLDDPASPLSRRVVYFDFDTSSVRDEDRPVLEAHAAYLAEHAGASVTLEGHADERGSREYNLGLGERRALAVRRLLVLLGAAGDQIRSVSYGEEKPAADGHDESAWQLNRRVEIIYKVR